MNANELADYLDNNVEAMLMSEQPHLDQAATMLRNQQALIENLNGRIEHMIEKQSHYEATAHAGGFEAGRELGMKQERALWELAASTQEAYILDLEKGLDSSINLNKAQAERNQ
jgi:hypothetical protein